LPICHLMHKKDERLQLPAILFMHRYGWMGGWVDGWMDGWMDGWILAPHNHLGDPPNLASLPPKSAWLL